MSYNLITFLHSLTLLVIIDMSNLMLVNCIQIIIGPNLSGCTQVFLTNNNSLYSHSEVFADTAKPSNVEIFKYHCTINLTLSTMDHLVSQNAFS